MQKPSGCFQTPGCQDQGRATEPEVLQLWGTELFLKQASGKKINNWNIKIEIWRKEGREEGAKLIHWGKQKVLPLLNPETQTSIRISFGFSYSSSPISIYLCWHHSLQNEQDGYFRERKQAMWLSGVCHPYSSWSQGGDSHFPDGFWRKLLTGILVA